MKARSVTWRWLLLGVGAALAGLRIQAVSRHQLPRGVRAQGTGGEWQAPTAVWLIRQENGWLALSDRTPHPRGCSAEWKPEQQKFMEPCLGQVFDGTGLNIGGPAPRGLDRYPVTVKSDSLIEVDLTRPQPVSQQ